MSLETVVLLGSTALTALVILRVALTLPVFFTLFMGLNAAGWILKSENARNKDFKAASNLYHELLGALGLKSTLDKVKGSIWKVGKNGSTLVKGLVFSDKETQEQAKEVLGDVKNGIKSTLGTEEERKQAELEGALNKVMRCLFRPLGESVQTNLEAVLPEQVTSYFKTAFR